ncbi:hypothetical protein A4A49_50257, partial [Nicotiana attenuata]
TVKNQAVKGVSIGGVDKGTPKITRDVPAKTALATILNAVNPIVQAYDKLHAANDETAMIAEGVRSVGEQTNLSRKKVDNPTGVIVTAEVIPNATAVTQVCKQQQTLNVQAGVNVTLNDTATPSKIAAATSGSNLDDTVALNSPVDRAVSRSVKPATVDDLLERTASPIATDVALKAFVDDRADT